MIFPLTCVALIAVLWFCVHYRVGSWNPYFHKHRREAVKTVRGLRLWADSDEMEGL